MNDNEHNPELSRSVFRFALVAGALQDFSTQIIAHVVSGETLDDEALAVIKATCIRDLKNSSLPGMATEREVAFLQQAVMDLGRAIDKAVAIGMGE